MSWENCMSRTQDYEWFKHFKNDYKNTESDEQFERPATSKN